MAKGTPIITDLENANKVTILTETENDDKMFNWLQFNIEKVIIKGDNVIFKIVGNTKVKKARLHISKLKLKGIL